MSSPPPSRRPRADAARNRERLVAAARTAFASGTDEPSLEAVARAAGVGIGTLYRHFPTRQDLVAAVYGSELDAVLAGVDDLLAEHDGRRALRTFASQYASFVATKREMAEVVRTTAIRAAAETVQTRERVNAAIARFLEQGAADGSLRDDLRADDVTAALVGVLLGARDRESDPEQVDRVLDIVVAGLARD
ncbi:TetR family transcriptional regulator [Curtobacterium sp. 1P10AnD]|uniref:TetR/AcrR family transcriptional regulator n=1 Tax=Curtobacterium sp. 1P10AnD TaxID=3132283 RepID=UPI0039A0FE8C